MGVCRRGRACTAKRTSGLGAAGDGRCTPTQSRSNDRVQPARLRTRAAGAMETRTPERGVPETHRGAAFRDLLRLPADVLEHVLRQAVASASLRALLATVEAACPDEHAPARRHVASAVDRVAAEAWRSHAAAAYMCAGRPPTQDGAALETRNERRRRVRTHPDDTATTQAEDNLAMMEFVERLECCIDTDAVPSPRQITVWAAGRNDAGQGARVGGDVNDLAQAHSLPSPHDYQEDAALLPHGEDTQHFDGVAPPVHVAAGLGHSAVLTACGSLFMCGANESGQLGTGDLLNRSSWVPLERNLHHTRIAKVTCGARHTLMLTADGRLLACGANDHGQLGCGPTPGAARDTRQCANTMQASRSLTASRADHPVECTGVELANARWTGGVVQIEAASAHSVVLLSNGRVYCAGDNSKGQLGLRSSIQGSATFAPVDCYGHRVVRVGCGADTTMLLTRDNMVLVSGKRANGLSVIGGLGSSFVSQLAVGNGFALARTSGNDAVMSLCRKRFEVTEELVDLSTAHVSANVGHYALVTADGGAMACGYNAFGQIAAGQMGLTIQGGLGARVIRPHRIALSPVQLPPGTRALSVACGAYHTLYLLASD